MEQLTPDEIIIYIKERTGDTYLTDHHLGVLRDLCGYQVSQLTKVKSIDRETLAQKIYSLNPITPLAMARPLTWDELLETTRKSFRGQADQILPLFPTQSRPVG